MEKSLAQLEQDALDVKVQKWVIRDWAGNKPYGDREFDTFEDGWELIRTDHPDEEDWQEFYVELGGVVP